MGYLLFCVCHVSAFFAWMSDDMGDTKSGLQEVIERGDVYLICVALVGDSLGRFAMVDQKKVIDMIGLGFALAFAMMMSFEFGTLNSMLHATRPVPAGMVFHHSVVYVASMFILGLGAVIRTED
ncbi:hypothetical protein [Tunturiibacter gelidiferens]|uniref:hypothetical protein n=1 Tax=Tunturiibacter gelidiferens TaxID=3069689 RepID=UPI003D9AF4AA